MENVFTSALSTTMQHEGGVNEKEIGQGGVSNQGVTQTTYDFYRKRKNLPSQDVRSISKEEVTDLYSTMFYKEPKFDMLPAKVGVQMFDYGVNAYPTTATKALQRVVGADEDGAIGPQTLGLMNKYIEANGEDELINKILDERQKHYDDLIKKDPKKYKSSEKGWKKRVESMRPKKVKNGKD